GGLAAPWDSAGPENSARSSARWTGGAQRGATQGFVERSARRAEGPDQRRPTFDRRDRNHHGPGRGGRHAQVRVTADTNVLLRALVGDDADQQRVAVETLDSAETVAISIQTLCELVWVLARGYRTSRQDIASAIRQLLD